jgi:xylan 1,4-beta-xylosidase
MTDQATRTGRSDARADWEQRIYTRLTDVERADPATELPAPGGVNTESCAGFVLLRWNPVPGAAGYLIERTDEPNDEPRIVTHGGSDVPAIPGVAFADTGVDDGATYCYRVGAVAGAEHPVWHWSTPVTGRTSAEPAGPVHLQVDAGRIVGTVERPWYMVGSERLTQLMFGADDTGHDIGAEFAEALRLGHDDLGVTHVRAHAILHDDNAVATRDDDGRLGFDFAIVDRLYDQILKLGVRPIVELSFMPAELAADPEQTVFVYRGIISPPRDWGEWRDLVGALVAHFVERYGIDEVAQWGFEVWNEPNLVVFWSGTKDEYLRLYSEAARAVKQVDPRLSVGGPATAAGEWIESLAAHVQTHGVPLDFATSHTYGNMPLDARPALRRHGFGDIPIYWTEWGVGSTHFGKIHDGVIGAPFVLSGYAAVRGRMRALSYWVISDHFEELGRPPALFHNGFGLLTVGNLRKPRYWAVHLAAHQGEQRLSSQLVGDGADVLVEADASRHRDGTVDLLVWNGTTNADLVHGDARLDRQVVVEVSGLDAASYRAQLARIDEQHSNVLRFVPDGTDWPDEGQLTELRTQDALHTEDLPELRPGGGHVRLELDVPMPGVARLRLTPQSSHPTDEEIAR